MEKNDTVKLLEQLNIGTKMAVDSIEEVVSKVCNNTLKQILEESKSQHQQLERQIRNELSSNSVHDREPNPIAKGMSWLKTNVRVAVDKNDDTIAELIYDGCNMGVKNLHKNLNDLNDASDSSKKLCNQLITLEKNLATDISCYL